MQGKKSSNEGEGNPAEIWDYVDYCLNLMSKVHRTTFDPRGDSEAYYDTFFSDLDVAMFSQVADPRRELRGGILLEAILSRVEPTSKLLDVGCGTGDNLKLFANSRLDLHGVEYSPVSAGHARRLLSDRAAIATGSAMDLPYDDDAFDAAICIEVLEHVPDDEMAMREIARVLKPKGILAVSVPYRRYFSRYLKTMGHFRHYTRSSLDASLREAGLVPVQYLANCPRWSRKANYAYIACRVAAMARGLLGPKTLPQNVRLPFARQPMMDSLFTRLAALRAAEEGEDYAAKETSTFIVAQRV
jgi:SAM-dependent methyltransferase